MTAVVIALLPAAGFGIYNFGPRALAVMAVTIASTVLTELLFGWLWKKKITISDMSAVVTGLLLALPLAKRDTSLHVHGAVSTPYLDMTLDTAARFGIEISQRDYEEFYIPGRQHYRSTYFSIEGDWSAAAMLLVAGATAGEVTVRNVSMLSKQADTAICTALVRAGAAVINEEDSVTALHLSLIHI